MFPFTLAAGTYCNTAGVIVGLSTAQCNFSARLSSALAKMVETQGPQQDSIFQTQLMRNDGHGWYGMVWNGVLFACEMCINVLNI